jgi:hypothetical protein
MMPYQVYQLYQAERTKTTTEIRRTDEQLGELSRGLSLAWHQATRPKALLRAILGAVAGSRLARMAGEHGPVTRPVALHRADYLTQYHPCFPLGGPSAPGCQTGESGA